MPTFYEFFAGGGMARIGLGDSWDCLFANDISNVKAEVYKRYFRGSAKYFSTTDINKVTSQHLPGRADLIWGSFPCQDLSLAGNGHGLRGTRSGLVWKLLEIVEQLQMEHRGPKLLVLENVTGFLNARSGADFFGVLERLNAAGFLYGILAMDAERFLPQSRPRVFLVAADVRQITPDLRLVNGQLTQGNAWSSARLDSLYSRAPRTVRKNWVKWSIPLPQARTASLAHMLETGTHIKWDRPEYTGRLVELMSPLHRRKLEAAMSSHDTMIGALYRRTRLESGHRKQRVEVRFDGLSGCLRTPTGGSSRQRLLFVNGPGVRSRLLTAREAARLMGLPDSYKLPDSYNDAYHLAGDGVAVPVVSWLSEHLLLPLLSGRDTASAKLRYA